MTALGEPPTAPPTIRPPRPFVTADWAWIAALALAAVALFAPTARFGFIYVDDPAYVSANPYVQHGLSWAGLRWAATALIYGNWHPLTLLAELLLSTLFGPSAATFHVANAVLHGITTALVFAFLRAATGRTGPSAAVAALWSVHPLRVESVAWVAELKDGLSGSLWFACLLAYVGYARHRTAGRYVIVAALLALALLAKPIAVTLPAVLLMLDYWPLGPAHAPPQWWARRIGEKAPLALLAGAAGAARLWTEGNKAALVAMPLRVRSANAVVSTLTYLRQTAWPTRLGVFYPHPWIVHQPIPILQVAIGAVAIAGISAAVLIDGRRHRYLVVGWGWFLVTLLPTIGLLQAGEQSHADRYTYLPHVGLLVAVVWLAADWAAGVRARMSVAITAAVLAVVALLPVTFRLIQTWSTPSALFGHAMTVIPDNFTAATGLALDALNRGDETTAEQMARRAVALAPDSAGAAHAVLAEVAEHRGRPAVATVEYDLALQHDAGNVTIRLNAAAFLIRQHQDAAAIRQLRQVVHWQPTNAAAWDMLGILEGKADDFPAAIDAFNRALAIVPRTAQIEGRLADALRLSGDHDAAVHHYAAAVTGGATDPVWEAWLAYLTAEDGRSTADQLAPLATVAKSACDQAGDRDSFPLYAYSLVLARLGRFDDAVAAATAAGARARAAGHAGLAADIERRLAAYHKGLVAFPATAAPATTLP